MTSKILDRFAKMSLDCHFFDLIGPSITFLLLRSSMSKSQKPVKKLGSKTSKHHKKKEAKVAEKEKEKPKKRKAKHIIVSEEDDEEVDSEWIPERHAGEVEVTVV